MAEGKSSNKNITTVSTGLNKDIKEELMPKGSYSFALNAVTETDKGDLLSLGTEQSNEECFNLGNKTPLGKVYIDDGETAILSVDHDTGNSEIGVVDMYCNYTTILNFDLGFKVTNQIDLVYRLRNGCDKTIYWVDGKNNPPMNFTLNRPDLYQDSNGNFIKEKFYTQNRYSLIPKIEVDRVSDNGGNLEIGGYYVSIQYLDAGLNGTDWIYETPVINITKDVTSLDFSNIYAGIANQEVPFFNEKTSKAIHLIITNLEHVTYPFYRLAFIEKTSGTGEITSVKYTNEIPTSKNKFIYTGENYAGLATEDEISLFTNLIDGAESNEQIENRYILSNITGIQTDFCKLQSYASKIKTDAYLKRINLNSINGGSSKDSIANFTGVGYMPGEIYSLGIVYIFDGGFVSPVYHIPGKSPVASQGMVYSPYDNQGAFDINVVPMSKEDNRSESDIYTDKSSCSTGDYWGRDCHGMPLVNQSVRHHRFPRRKDIGIPLIEQDDNNLSQEIDNFYITIKGIIDINCSQEQIDEGECTNLETSKTPFTIRVTYDVGGVSSTKIITIDPSDYEANEDNEAEIDLIELIDSTYGIGSISNILIEEEDGLGNFHDVTNTEDTDTDSAQGLQYKSYVETDVEENIQANYSTQIFGLKFSNIEIPQPEDIGGKTIIGYYIVRQERDDVNKTVIDSAVMFNTYRSGTMQNNKEFTGFSLLNPQRMPAAANNPSGAVPWISNNVLAFYNPEFAFNSKKYSVFNNIEQCGYFDITAKYTNSAGPNKDYPAMERFRYRDVKDGTSYNPDRSKKHRKKLTPGGDKVDLLEDKDGWSLKGITRDSWLEYVQDDTLDKFSFDFKDDIERVHYLNPLESVKNKAGDKSLYNTSADNKIGLIEFKQDYNNNYNDSTRYGRVPFVYIRNTVANPYSNFRIDPFYKISNNVETKDTCIVFGGDSYVTPMKFVNSLFFSNEPGYRIHKSGVWKIVGGSVIIAAAAVLAFFTGGATIGLVGVGASLLSSGVEQYNWAKAYQSDYSRGLRDLVVDYITFNEYYYTAVGKGNGSTNGEMFNGNVDDEIQWLFEALTNLWFESSVNINLRYDFTDGKTNGYIPAPAVLEDGKSFYSERYRTDFPGNKRLLLPELITPKSTLGRYAANKLTLLNSEKTDGREYMGHTTGEFYKVNPDFDGLPKVKSYFPLGIEYDCCSDCIEEFPHRIMYSEVAFQEELSDNYKVFLHNNYTTLNGNTGKITDLFTLGNSLFVHTEEALFKLPQNMQERVTGDFTTYIGTGEFLSVPPQLMIDNNLESAGTIYKWATLKTPQGVFFVSSKDLGVRLFNGQELQPINKKGLEKWFKENIPLSINNQYYALTGKKYPYENNPSSNLGAGFISTYDTQNERFILTKKDFIMPLSPEEEELLEGKDLLIYINNNGEIVFFDYSTIIEEKEAEGYTYEGFEDGQMKFCKEVEEIDYEISYEWSFIPEDVYVYVMLDATLTYSPEQNLQIIDAVTEWYEDAVPQDANKERLKIIYEENSNCGEMWLMLANNHIEDTINTYGADKVIVLSFIHETDPFYHRKEIVYPVNNTYTPILGQTGDKMRSMQPTDKTFAYNNSGPSTHCTNNLSTAKGFTENYTDFVALRNNLNFFLGIKYPVFMKFDLFSRNSGTQSYFAMRAFLQHMILAIEGRALTELEVDTILNRVTTNSFWNPPFVHPCDSQTYPNPISYSYPDVNINTAQDMIQLFKDSLMDTNPYASLYANDGTLKDLGWDYIIGADEEQGDLIINPSQFANDINHHLRSLGKYHYIEVRTPIQKVTKECILVKGISLRDRELINNSWTISYSIKANQGQGAWISWHSYLPSFYYQITGNFYSWRNGDSLMWRHNRRGSYLNFYNEEELSSFIVEVISNSNPLTTRIFDAIRFNTTARRYLQDTNEYNEERYVTFNKAVIYNTRQITGELELKVKDTDIAPEDYMMQQVEAPSQGVVIIDKNERDWTLNDIRDIRVDYTTSMFKKNLEDIQDNYYIDKVIDTSILDWDKDWEQLESFRDKYMVIRLIFDNFEDVKLIFNFSVEDENQSFR